MTSTVVPDAVAAFDTTMTAIGLGFTGMTAAYTLVQLPSGVLSDRVGRDPVTIAVVVCSVVVCSVVGYALLAAPRPLPLVVGAVALVGVGMSWSASVRSQIVDRLSASDRGTGFGAVRTVYILVGVLGSTAAGVVSTRAGWQAASALFAGLLGSAALAVTVTRWVRFER